jgi:hypothetical protein
MSGPRASVAGCAWIAHDGLLFRVLREADARREERRVC